MAEYKYIKWFEELGVKDTPSVGGKNSSLGEMISALKTEGVDVPDGYATTAAAYREFIAYNNIGERLARKIEKYKSGDWTLQETGKSIRRMFRKSEFPKDFSREIRRAYRELSDKYGKKEVDVAVRSSATAEDLPEASFAGQQETFLNVTGGSELLGACKKCFASLFTDRAINYREERGFDHLKIALSIGVQKMVRSDRGGSGVMFSLDTDTGFRKIVLINAGWGLGENIVRGKITPDEYIVFKPLLENENFRPIIEKNAGDKEKKMIYSAGTSETTKNIDTTSQEREAYVLKDEEILRLAKWAVIIEKHYGKPMDMEWAKDGELDRLFIVQARPETVYSSKLPGVFKHYKLKERSDKLLQGLAIGEAIASGEAQVIQSAEEMDRFHDGAILVTGMTDPDWEPIMKKASGIVTDHGGRTSHAAIVSRELGIPAVVGTSEATKKLKDGEKITISCSEGSDGFVYDGELNFDEKEINIEDIPDTRTRIMINISSPSGVFRWWRLPVNGIGLARMEFIINNAIKIHPMALVRYSDLKDKEAKQKIKELTYRYDDKAEYFVDNLSMGIAKIAASQYPEPVILRMSDFKTNEYANLIGGKEFEPKEDNPMLGFRGASRYYSERYKEGFRLECRAVKRVRDEIGLENIKVMIPFCRTIEEAEKVLKTMEDFGLRRGDKGLEVYMTAEIPSNVVLAEEFAEYFDGFSIGSNDLTQLVLGVDRDSEILSELFDERNQAVKETIRELIQKAHSQNTSVGICGQAPSDYPDFGAFLVDAGIDSISLNPDSVIDTKLKVAKKEEKEPVAV